VEPSAPGDDLLEGRAVGPAHRVGISFGTKWIRSSVASARHFVGSEPCFAASWCAALLSALSNAARHRLREPRPQ
jgi:hypothetical protein